MIMVSYSHTEITVTTAITAGIAMTTTLFASFILVLLICKVIKKFTARKGSKPSLERMAETVESIIKFMRNQHCH